MPSVTIPMASNRAITAPAKMISTLGPRPRGGAGKDHDFTSGEAASPDCSANAGSIDRVELRLAARSSFLFTSESVSEGHPDKVADRISDTVVDAFLAKDPEARVACETLVTTQRIVLAGEVRATQPGATKEENEAFTQSIIDSLEPLIRAAVKDIGYEQDGFHWETADYACYLHAQSADIAIGVDSTNEKDEGAGDQGIMFGYASNETPELMPATLQYSHNILKRLAEVRHAGGTLLEPDAKSQVTIEYEDGKPVRAASIVLSTQHAVGKAAEVEALVKPYILEVLPEGFTDENTVWHINPTGIFEIGGPDGDTGLTGRKIIVDTYGGAAPHGGGAFSGKDPTKVDRSAAYACRYLAKNVVAAGLADRCTIQISYAIGVAKPQSIHVDMHGTGKVAESLLESKLLGLIGGATPRAIREHLGLNKPVYARTTAYGHFGREPDADGGFSWEKTDLVDQLKTLATA
ncbi:hypothetical protein LTR94_024211 [Friedmanniomyces endolithicus]|nr:hypothetical protein LTR94_024211 [Friedmanniomyces endolithicus]